jgi:PIN domain nuclease of toxin-antitoxin system
LASPERLLLDTHAFLWALQAPHLLEGVREWLADDSRSPLLSAVSVWEVSMLVRNGRIELPDACLREFITDGIATLNATVMPLYAHHVVAFHDLPAHHKDAFDLMLIAQALHEGAALATLDKTIRRHSDVQVLW